MPLDPNIILGVHQPETPSPLQSIAGLMQLRGQMSEIALRQAQQETARQNALNIQAETAQKQRDVADQNTIQSIEKDPGSYAKILSGDLSPLAGKVSEASLTKVRSNVDTALQNEALRSKEELDRRTAAAKTIGANLASAAQTFRGDDGKLDVAGFNSVLPSLIAEHAPELKALGVDPNTLPKSVEDEAHLNLLASRVNAFGSMLEAAQGLKAKQAETAKNAAEGEKAKTAAALDQFKLDLIKGGGTDIGAKVDALIDPVKFPQANKDAKAAAEAARLSGDPAKMAEAVQKVYEDQVGKPASAAATARAQTPALVERGKAMIPVEAAAAGARARAEIQPHIDQAVQTQIELAKNAPGAFSGITEPTARAGAERQFDTDTSAYVKAAGSAQDLKNLVAAAQKGNRAAAAVVPLAEVRSFVNRVNQTELHGVAGAGSLADSIMGKIGKITEGQPIPANILQDVNKLADLQIQNASRNYDASINALKQKGANPKRVALPGTVEVNAGGVTHVFGSENEAKAFENLVKQAGGQTSRE